MKESINKCINERDKARDTIIKFSYEMENTTKTLDMKGEKTSFINYMMKKEFDAFMWYDVCNEVVNYKSNNIVNKYKKILALIGIIGIAGSIGLFLALMGSPLCLLMTGSYFGLSAVMGLTTIAALKKRLGSQFIPVSKRFYNKVKLVALNKFIKTSLFLKKNKSKGKGKSRNVYDVMYEMQCFKSRCNSLIFKSNNVISMYSNLELGGRCDTEEEVKHYTGYGEFKENMMIKDASNNDEVIEKRIKMDIYEEVKDLRIMLDGFTIKEKGEFYSELNDIVTRYNIYMASSEKDIMVKADIARDIDILRNKISNMAKSKTGTKKRTLERE